MDQNETKAAEAADLTIKTSYHRARVNVLRSKHQFIINLAGQGKSASDIKSIVDLIDWEEEIRWRAEDIEAGRLTKDGAPLPPPAPPNPGAAVVNLAQRVPIPPLPPEN